MLHFVSTTVVGEYVSTDKEAVERSKSTFGIVGAWHWCVVRMQSSAGRLGFLVGSNHFQTKYSHKTEIQPKKKPKTPSTQCRSAEKCPLQDYHLLYYCCEYFHHAFPAVYGAFHRVNAAFVLEIWLFWFSFSVGSTMLYPFVLSHCLCTVPWC